MESASIKPKFWSRLVPSLRIWKNLHSWFGVGLCLVIINFGGTGVFMLNRDLFGLRTKPVHFAPVEWWYTHMMAPDPVPPGRRPIPGVQAGADAIAGADATSEEGGEVRPPAPARRGQGLPQPGGIPGGFPARDRKAATLTLYTDKGEAVQVAAENGALMLQDTGAQEWRRLDETRFKEIQGEATIPAAAFARPGGAAGAAPGRNALQNRPVTWGRVINDLHRGRFFKGNLNIYYTIGAGGLVFLSLSGIWLWGKPLWMRIRRKRAQPA